MATVLKKIFVEVAASNLKRHYGLMNRHSLAKNDGMLFKFDKPDNLNFWMQNTYIPLDIAFIDDNGQILQIESMKPLSTRHITSKNKCRYALEVNRDWFKNNEINVGQFINSSNNIKRHGVSLNPVNADVQIDLNNKEKIKNANLKDIGLIIIYVTKDGQTLPPKRIVPPFNLERDENGKNDAILKAWDDQTASWKSFIIDNIISVEEDVENKKDINN